MNTIDALTSSSMVQGSFLPSRHSYGLSSPDFHRKALGVFFLSSDVPSYEVPTGGVAASLCLLKCVPRARIELATPRFSGVSHMRLTDLGQ